jgi:hypothetical protein
MGRTNMLACKKNLMSIYVIIGLEKIFMLVPLFWDQEGHLKSNHMRLEELDLLEEHVGV